ncbi:MAG: sensor histidine kinase [Bacteroidota bacterium]
MTLNRTFHRTILLLILAAGFVSLGRSQEYAIRTFTTHDGLISNYVTALKQDTKGYLWIGTDEGVSIFDGSSFRNIHPREKEMWGYVNSFFESGAQPGVMWIATNGGGVIRYRDGSYTQLKIDTVMEANKVNDVYEDGHGILWLTTDNGLYRVQNGSTDRITLPPTHSSYLIQILPMGADTVWISSPAGIISYDTRSGTVSTVLKAEIGGTNGQIFPLRDGLTAVISFHGLKLLRNKDIVQDLPLPRGNYGNGTLDGAGNLWVGGSECVWRLQKENGTFRLHSSLEKKNGLPVNDVSALVLDRENNLWFGTFGKGIARLQDPENMRFPFDKLTSRGTSDNHHRIWAPTLDGVYSLRKNKNRTWHSSFQRFSGKETPIALQAIGNDRLWCTTFGLGIAEYRVSESVNGDTHLSLVRTYDTRNGCPKLYVIVLFKDSRGYLWCSKVKEGIVVVDPRSPNAVKQIFSSFPGIPATTISTFVELPDGRIVCGGIGSNALFEFTYENGTYRYTGAVRFDRSISQYGIRSLAVSPDSSLWIGTRYDGLLRRRKDGSVTEYSFSSGLHNMQILSLQPDGNALWVGTQSGLEYVPDIVSPRFILSTELTTSPIYTLGMYSDHTVWAMTGHELTLNDPAALIAPSPVPPIYLTQFDVNGVPQPLTPEQEFIRNDLISCSFSYSAVTLKGNTDVKYQYRLGGLHGNWQNLTPERSVTFANLGPGEYTFIVRAVLNNGKQVTESVTQSFVIVPALWDRWWFAPLIISIILSVIAGISILRIRQRFALEKIRVSIAADLHDDIGSVLARIANLADILVVYGSTKRIPSVKTAKTVKSTKKRIIKRSLPEENAQTIADLSRELMEKMSDVVWSVNPDNDDPKKLTERLQTYCTEIAEHHHLRVNFSADGVFERRSIDPQKTRAALLIVKESLANILKHANAKQIDLSVAIMPKRWSITIADDGVGFNEDELPRVNGIYNMRSRAAACGGDVQVSSSSGNGTTIRLEIPL